MDKNRLRQVIVDQQGLFHEINELIDRDIELGPYLKCTEIVIITGIRRCGKSSLLKLIAKRVSGAQLYINFDDVRLADFSKDNFQDIQDIAVELSGKKDTTYFLDEAQNVQNWERWVNTLHAQNLKVFITGSNSKLLSSEISTYLTGRNRVITLFPFSFKEYLTLRQISLTANSTSAEQSLSLRAFKEYLNAGGFPQVIKSGDIELSKHFFDDILNKDILNRHSIRQIKEVKGLLIYLISNVGRIYAYSTLKQITGIKSLSTIKNYIEYLNEVYLLCTIGRFDYSLKKQKTSSSKPYAGDISFLRTIAFNFSENIGQRLENIVFLNLIQQQKQVFYHLEKKECDFVIKEGLRVTQAVQVCSDLSNSSTKKREIEGLLHAMTKYSLTTGLLLTMETEETVQISEKTIIIKPVWKWLVS